MRLSQPCSDILRTVVLLFCTAGVIYQVVDFYNVYYSYPVISVMRTKEMNEVELPALTICPFNGLRRRQFCNDFPEKCHIPSNESYCVEYPVICRLNNKYNYWKYPFEKVISHIKSRQIMTPPSLFEKYGPQLNTVIKDCWYLSEEGYRDCRNNSAMQILAMDDHYDYKSCYRVNAEIDTTPETQQRINGMKGYRLNIPILKFTTDLEQIELFERQVEFGANIDISNPYDLIRPFFSGLVIYPGKSYVIMLDAYEITLLPPPYETKCRDYVTERKTNLDNGSSSQQRCFLNCLLDQEKKTGCIDLFLYYPVPTTKETSVCQNDYWQPDDGKKMCSERCEVSCREIFYNVEMFEHNSEENIEASIPNDIVSVEVYIKYPYMRVYSMEPKFSEIECFSYVGSCLGLWIGLSMYSLHHFLKITVNKCLKFRRFIQILYHHCQRKKVAR